MVVRLRLARHHNTRNSPSYSIVATNSSLRTTAKPLEVLGSYRPIPAVQPTGGVPGMIPARLRDLKARDQEQWGPRQFTRTDLQGAGEKKVEWNVSRIKWWLAQGAQPSKTVEELLKRAGLGETEALRQEALKEQR